MYDYLPCLAAAAGMDDLPSYGGVLRANVVHMGRTYVLAVNSMLYSQLCFYMPLYSNIGPLVHFEGRW